MDRIEQAFKTVDRKQFVADASARMAKIDEPLPIGYGQTISQPTTVRRMLRWLDTQPSEKVLDVGSGSGWTTALLSHIVGSQGSVFAVERIPQLIELGRTNCDRAGVRNATFFQAGKEVGLPRHAPYDRILVSASAQTLPLMLLSQLRVGGKLVIPVRNDILEITKKSEHAYETNTHAGFMFVPLL